MRSILARFRIESLTLPEQVSPARLQSRDALLTGLNASRQANAAAIVDYERLSREAMSMLLSGTASGAFAIDKEPTSYGIAMVAAIGGSRFCWLED